MKGKKGLILQLLGLISCCFLFLIVWKDKASFLTILKTANFSYLPEIIFFSYLAIFLSSLGFVLVAKLFGINTPVSKSLPIAFSTIVINNLMAFGGAAGFTVRVLLFKKHNQSAKHVLAASFFHTYLYTIGITAFVPYSLIYLYNNFKFSRNEDRAIVIGAYSFFIAFVLISLIFLIKKVRRFTINLVQRFSSRVLKRDLSSAFNNFDFVISEGLKATSNKLWYLPTLLILVLFDYISGSLAFFYCFKSLGINLSHQAVFSGLTIGASAGILSMIPGGLGVQEASLSEIFKLMGVNFNIAILTSLFYRMIFYVIPFFVALVYLYLANTFKKRS